MKKIVIADDEAHIRHIVSMKLANAGYEVLTAADGEEALELVTGQRPAAVITDYQMPYMSGLDLCRKLGESETTRSIPVLLLTARGFDIESYELNATGVVDVMAKPFSPRELLRKVQELVGDLQPETA